MQHLGCEFEGGIAAGDERRGWGLNGGYLASHLIEHLRQPLPLMQELHRVCRRDAMAVFVVPYGSSDSAWADPTHVRPYFLESWIYFGQPAYWRADYHYRGDWQTERIILQVERAQYEGVRASDILEAARRGRNVIVEMIAELRAIKPIRPPQRELQRAPEIAID